MSVSSAPPVLKRWLIAGRPWSWPASIMPVIYGTSLAVVVGGARLSVWKFLTALAAMMILHAAANMLSDVIDFRRGLDTVVTPSTGAVARRWLPPATAARGAAAFFALGALMGLLLALKTGWALVAIGAVGLPIGVFYPLLKYRAFGDVAVFLDFGILGSLGAWTVQTRTLSLTPVVWTIPMAMLVIAILHANNWRDSASDKEKKIRTVASILGDAGSFRYYHVLVFGPFLVVLGLMLLPRSLPGGLAAMPVTFLLVLLGLPQALELSARARRRRTPRRPLDFIVLDGATANYSMIFGLLSTAALWVHLALTRL